MSLSTISLSRLLLLYQCVMHPTTDSPPSISYRLAPDEYTVSVLICNEFVDHSLKLSIFQILASAAAIATAALTTASTSSFSFLEHDTEMQSKENVEGRTDDDSGNLSGSTSRALTEEEQEEITILLRAWVSIFFRYKKMNLTDL